MQKTIVYMAGPLFTLAERNFNVALKRALAERLPAVEFVLPQERAEALLPNLQAVTQDCFIQVERATIVLANLDNPDADSGTAVEVGYARGLGRPVIAYRTDFRGNEVDGVNAMLRFGVTRYLQVPAYCATLESLADALQDALYPFMPQAQE